MIDNDKVSYWLYPSSVSYLPRPPHTVDTPLNRLLIGNNEREGGGKKPKAVKVLLLVLSCPLTSSLNFWDLLKGGELSFFFFASLCLWLVSGLLCSSCEIWVTVRETQGRCDRNLNVALQRLGENIEWLRFLFWEICVQRLMLQEITWVYNFSYACLVCKYFSTKLLHF